MNRKISDIDFRFDGLSEEARSLGVAHVFERIRLALRAVREVFEAGMGPVPMIREDVPPTTPPTAAALPAASARLIGQMVQVDGNGVADDTVHICIRDSVGAYVWKQFTLV